MRLMIASLALLGCGGSQRPEPTKQERIATASDGCVPGPPRGEPSQMTTPVHASSGPSIDPPIACDGGGGRGTYIRVHGRGARRIEMGQDGKRRCKEPPPTPDACAFADEVGEAISKRLEQRGVPRAGYGLGACGNPDVVELDRWKYSIIIHDWSHADAAIAAVDEELRAQNIGHSFGVSVTSPSCAVLETSR